MLDFMDYIQLAFTEATDWNRDNSYASLTATAQSLLDFSTPERLRVHLSSLATPHFATSYTLGTVGMIDGSVSYLYSTVPFNNLPSRSALIPLRKLSPGYRQVQPPVAPVDLEILKDSSSSSSSHNDESSLAAMVDGPFGQKPTLLHATLHLPPPTTLNALFLRRISPTMQLALAVCSTRGPPLSKSAPQASLLTQLSHDTGKYSNEYLFSTDNSLFGWRGLWNFGPDPRGSPSLSPDQRVSLLSAGAEAYYSPVSSLIGMSTGLRFSTLPAATEGLPSSPRSSPSSSSTPTSPSNSSSPISTFPYTITLSLTPLTGSLSTTYSLRASPNLAFSSRFGFNVYSWESEMVAGCELWRRSSRKITDDDDDSDGLEWARRKMRMTEWPSSALLSGSVPTTTTTSPPPPTDAESDHATDSVLKIRVDQSWNVRVLWEGRVKELLVSAGVGLGPGSFAGGSLSGAGGGSGTTGGGGAAGMSYWKGVGVSVSYSS